MTRSCACAFACGVFVCVCVCDEWMVHPAQQYARHVEPAVIPVHPGDAEYGFNVQRRHAGSSNNCHRPYELCFEKKNKRQDEYEPRLRKSALYFCKFERMIHTSEWTRRVFFLFLFLFFLSPAVMSPSTTAMDSEEPNSLTRSRARSSMAGELSTATAMVSPWRSGASC